MWETGAHEPTIRRADVAPYLVERDGRTTLSGARKLKRWMIRSLAQIEFTRLHLHDATQDAMRTHDLRTGEGESIPDLVLPMADSASARGFLGQQPMVVRSLDDFAHTLKVKAVLEKMASESCFVCLPPATG